MTVKEVKIDENTMRKLLGAASPDAALLYLYMYAGNQPESAEEKLHMSASRVSCAGATLRQMGLWPEERRSCIAPGERPAYSEREVLNALDREESFRKLYEEIQRVLGRSLNTEELKIVLGFVRYLGLPSDVIIMLVYFCRDRARQRGAGRNPSLRSIEKEAYLWAENGVDTIEEASAYIQNQNFRHSRVCKVMELLQIRGRNLIPAEEKYINSWIERGFEDKVLALAFERTCLNTGGMNWPYMNSILKRWGQSGWLTEAAVLQGDRKPGSESGTSGARRLDQDEINAIRNMMEGE